MAFFNKAVQERPPVQNMRQRVPATIRMNQILELLKEVDGQPITYDEICERLNISYGSANTAVKGLMSRGAITRRGKKGRFYYIVRRTRVNRIIANPIKGIASGPVELNLPEKLSNVFQYMVKIEGKPIFTRQASQDLGISQGAFTGHLSKLRSEDLVAIVEYTPHGAIYRITDRGKKIHSAPTPVTEKEKSFLVSPVPVGVIHSAKVLPQASEHKIDVAQKNEAGFNFVLDGLCWEFVKETSSTDLLEFLKWLKTKKT